jgi:hypothetical protein
VLRFVVVVIVSTRSLFLSVIFRFRASLQDGRLSRPDGPHLGRRFYMARKETTAVKEGLVNTLREKVGWEHSIQFSHAAHWVRAAAGFAWLFDTLAHNLALILPSGYAIVYRGWTDLLPPESNSLVLARYTAYVAACQARWWRLPAAEHVEVNVLGRLARGGTLNAVQDDVLYTVLYTLRPFHPDRQMASRQ